MSGMNSFHCRDAIRVRVKKCEGLLAPEYRRFSVDPQITSFEVLQSLLARAFDIKGEFSISYYARYEEGKDTYLSLLSDWDLDAAFLGSSDPCLQLKVDFKPFEEGLEDWDLVTPVDRSSNAGFSIDPSSITGTILNHMEKTFNMVQRAFNLSENDGEAETFKPVKQPMTDSEFHLYLDADGRLIKPRELRLSVYQRGIDQSLRKVVWKHILNVYPHGLTAKERIAYMKQCSSEYQQLRQTWQDMITKGHLTEEIQYVTNMVRKDVLRTDRTHKFYAGSDDNKNVVSLFNILTTYALHHPSVSYCQGMSDLASPILVTMKDEAHAYACFCALMQRLKPNFYLDGKAMTTNFQQLTELLEHYDSQFFEYLKTQGADDLLFCYRWLLLELKREFAFEDALTMLEVLWSSIPPSPPEKDLSLFEELFIDNAYRPQSPRIHSKENPYTKVRAIRKQNSASSIRGLMSNSKDDVTVEPENNTNLCSECSELSSICEHKKNPITGQSSIAEISNDDSQDYLPMTTSITRELRMELENLNRHLPGSFLQRSMTIDSEDLDSPRSPDCFESNRGDLKCSPDFQNFEKKRAEKSESCTSADVSRTDHIYHLDLNRKVQIPPEFLDLKGDKVTDDLQCCCISDEQCALEKHKLKHNAQSKDNFKVPSNGEILENEELEDKDGCACHLKSVIPIRLVHSPGIDNRYQNHSSDSSDSSSEGFPLRCEQKYYNAKHITPTNSCEEVFQNSSSLGDNSDEKTNSGSENMPNLGIEALEYGKKVQKSTLPSPYELGGGNPFMLFLCLTLLLQHRDIIMKSRMDYNELAMHFDKMVRKHNVHRVLHQARALFREYLQTCCQEQDSNPYV